MYTTPPRTGVFEYLQNVFSSKRGNRADGSQDAGGKTEPPANSQDTVEISQETIDKLRSEGAVFIPLQPANNGVSEEMRQKVMDSYALGVTRKFEPNPAGRIENTNLFDAIPRKGIVPSWLLIGEAFRPEFEVQCNFAAIDRLNGLEVGSSYDLFQKEKVGYLQLPSEMDIDYPLETGSREASYDDFSARVKDLIAGSDSAARVGATIDVTVDVQGAILVDGIDNAEVRAEVERVLNSDRQLGRQLFKSGFVDDFAADLKAGGSEQSRALEKAAVESYLRDQLGYDVRCDEAAYLHEEATGGDEKLKEFLRDDPLLYVQMLNLSNGSEVPENEYRAAWTFRLE